MGARPYNSTEGRFLTRDPVEGGCANAYVYTYGDPFTQQDLDGRNYCAHLTVLEAFDFAAALRSGARLSELLAKFGVGGPVAVVIEETLGLTADTFAIFLEAAADYAAFMAKKSGKGAKGMVMLKFTTFHVLGRDTHVPTGNVYTISYVDGGSKPFGNGAANGKPSCA
jgi:hypothetical protein